MPAIQVEPVTTERGRRSFVRFPWRVYERDPNWVPPLISERLEYLNPNLALFAEVDGDPVDFCVAIPDINRALIHLNGRLFPFGWLKLRHYIPSIDVVTFKLMGILETYRRRGIDALLYLQAIKAFYEQGYKWLDGSVTSETNPRINLLTQRLGLSATSTIGSTAWCSREDSVPVLNTGTAMTEALCRVVDKCHQREALVWGEVCLSYGELWARTESLACGLREELGIRQGDRVATLMLPGPAFACVFFAVARLGAVVVPLDAKLRRRQLVCDLQDAEPTVLVTSRPLQEETHRQAAALCHVIEVEGKNGRAVLADLMLEDVQSPSADVSPGDLLALLYTSGTTGAPKGTMHSHRSLIAPAVATLKVRELWERPSLRMLGKQIKAVARYRQRLLRVAGGAQTFLTTISWHNISGVEAMLQALLMGDRLVVMPHFHPRRAMELIEREQVTILIAVPMAYQVMLRLHGFEDYDVSSLIVCGTGAAPCPPHLARQIEERFGCAIHIGFGAAETAGGITVTSLANSEERRTGTVGRPLTDVEVKVVDDQGRELPAGRVGELACRGKSVMLGYYDEPAMTAQAIDDDGWYHTGDLGVMDQYGCIRVVGRKKDLIIRGGQNIYPAEIEDYLTAHPKIREAAVVGVPEQVVGENVWAFVVLEEGASMTAPQVLSYCRQEMEAYKIPSEVRFVNGFPCAQSGKVQKFKLRARALEELERRDPT
jgi:fatty-acyl-CoA synthase/long-chain acyl-CoA synthetase